MKRIVEVDEAYDKRNADPSKDGGIHGAQIRMVLKGEAGAVQFLLFTNRMLPHVQMESARRIRAFHPHISKADLRRIRQYSGPFTPGNEIEEVLEWERFLNKLELDELSVLMRPMAADLGYHSPVPLYDGQEPIRTMLKSPKFNQETGELTPAVYGDPVICPYLDGDVPCYFDGSGLNAIRIYEILRKQGQEAVWQELEKCYEYQFSERRSS